MNRRASALAVLLGTSALLAGCGSAAAPAGPAPAAGSAPRRVRFPEYHRGRGRHDLGRRRDGRVGREPRTTSGSCSSVRPAPAAGSWQPRRGSPITAASSSRARPRRRSSPPSGPASPHLHPLTQTGNAGRSWSSASAPIRGALADDPGALAAGPAAGQLLAVLTSGTAEAAAPGGTGWRTLATAAQIAASAAGRRCGLGQLTAGHVHPGGCAPARPVPVTSRELLACSHGRTGPGRQPGRSCPPATAREQVSVRSLTRTTTGDLALLTAGTGKARTFYAAQSGSTGTWTVSPPLGLDGAGIASVSSGPGGTLAVITTSGRAAAMTSPGQGWQTLPKLPARTVTLAPAAAVPPSKRSQSTARPSPIWQLAPGREGGSNPAD